MQPGAFPLPQPAKPGAPSRLIVGRRGRLITAATCALPALIPLGIVVGAIFLPAWDIWRHLVRYVLPDVVSNTLMLVLGVGAGTFVIGTSLAWLVTVYEFPGRRLFSWALMLPMAVPGYVLGFVAIGFFEYSGPFQTMLRAWFDGGVNVPAFRSYLGIVAVMTLTLYPYVFLIARAAFATQGQRALEVAQSAGYTRTQAFFRVALPMARPWLAGAVLLVVMETLADFGTVSVFNYDTFTTAIYKAWYSLFSIRSALQLASVLLLFVLVVVLLERKLRAGARYTAAGSVRRRRRIRVTGVGRWLAPMAPFLVILAGFILPALQLAVWATAHGADMDQRYLGYVGRTLFLAGIGAAMITAVAAVLSYAIRGDNRKSVNIFARIATMGYALPGAVLAVGIFVPLALLNNFLQDLLNSVMGSSAPQLMIQLSLLTLLMAYLARFLAVAFNPVDNNMHRITRSVDEAAYGLGVTGTALLHRVHFPILRAGLWTAMTLTFVDLMKELPITLMTRPFGWETLAVRVFEMTSEGEWQRAALPAIAIVATGLIPIAIMAGKVDRAAAT